MITACAGTCSRFLMAVRISVARWQATGQRVMKRYIIFAAIGPLIGGFFLLILGAPAGYWDGVNVIQKLFKVMLVTVPYNYLFGSSGPDD